MFGLRKVHIAPIGGYHRTEDIVVDSQQYGDVIGPFNNITLKLGNKLKFTGDWCKIGFQYSVIGKPSKLSPLTCTLIEHWFVAKCKPTDDITSQVLYPIRTQLISGNDAVSLLNLRGIFDLIGESQSRAAQRYDPTDWLLKSKIFDFWLSEMSPMTYSYYREQIMDLVAENMFPPTPFYSDGAPLFWNPSDRRNFHTEAELSFNTPWMVDYRDEHLKFDGCIYNYIANLYYEFDSDDIVVDNSKEIDELIDLSRHWLDAGSDWLYNPRYDNLDDHMIYECGSGKYYDFNPIHRFFGKGVIVERAPDNNLSDFKRLTQFASPIISLCSRIHMLPTFSLEFIYILSERKIPKVKIVSCDITCDRNRLADMIKLIMQPTHLFWDTKITEIRICKTQFDEMYVYALSNIIEYKFVVDLTLAAAVSTSIYQGEVESAAIYDYDRVS